LAFPPVRFTFPPIEKHSGSFQLKTFQLKEKITVYFLKEKPEKRKLTPQGRREGMTSFLLKILPEGMRVEIFNKTRQGLNLTALYADLSLLTFFWFLIVFASSLWSVAFLFLVLFSGIPFFYKLQPIDNGVSGKTALSKRWESGCNERSGAEWVADTVQR
jgi:hypothetical protein